jgi:hypothetical protein
MALITVSASEFGRFSKDGRLDRTRIETLRLIEADVITSNPPHPLDPCSIQDDQMENGLN